MRRPPVSWRDARRTVPGKKRYNIRREPILHRPQHRRCPQPRVGQHPERPDALAREAYRARRRDGDRQVGAALTGRDQCAGGREIGDPVPLRLAFMPGGLRQMRVGVDIANPGRGFRSGHGEYAEPDIASRFTGDLADQHRDRASGRDGGAVLFLGPGYRARRLCLLRWSDVPPIGRATLSQPRSTPAASCG